MNIECSRILLTSVSRELDCLTVHVSRDSRVSGFAGSVQHKCLKALFPYQSLQGLHQESVLPASCVRVGGGHPLRLLPGKNQRLAPNTFYSTHQVEQLSRCFYTDVLKCKGFLNSPDIHCVLVAWAFLPVTFFILVRESHSPNYWNIQLSGCRTWAESSKRWMCCFSLDRSALCCDGGGWNWWRREKC